MDVRKIQSDSNSDSFERIFIRKLTRRCLTDFQKQISNYKLIRMRIMQYPLRLTSAPKVYSFINPSDIR